MKNRNIALDVIRVVAMSGVILDHYLCMLGSNMLTNIGLCMGGGKCGYVSFFIGFSFWYKMEKRIL